MCSCSLIAQGFSPTCRNNAGQEDFGPIQKRLSNLARCGVPTNYVIPTLHTIREKPLILATIRATMYLGRATIKGSLHAGTGPRLPTIEGSLVVGTKVAHRLSRSTACLTAGGFQSLTKYTTMDVFSVSRNHYLCPTHLCRKSRVTHKCPLFVSLHWAPVLARASRPS